MIDSCSHREQKDHPFRSGAELRGPSRPERSQNYRTDVLVARAARLSGREGWDNTDSALDNRPLATPSEGWSRAANGASHLYYARQPGRASERKWPPEIGSGPCGHGDSGCPECLDDLHAARREPRATRHAPHATRRTPRAVYRSSRGRCPETVWVGIPATTGERQPQDDVRSGRRARGVRPAGTRRLS